MLIASWVLLLALLFALFTSLLEGGRNPNREPELRSPGDGALEVVLLPNRQGHYLVSGHINGYAVTFMVDTGATDVAVPEPLAQSASMSMGHAGVGRTANGDVVYYSSRIDRLDIGGIMLTDVPASIMPTMTGSEVLLGMSALRRLGLLQQGRKLTLRLPAADPHQQ
ncbi:MAG: hypothetical protein B0D96_01600 [Candidatus Sedimenticola endophacoides]|uniref:TIGR02281 family clan AA aspartic protease n=1 Tax=Candidatus Sedimenticola endophacoides TaxID=2548426 RepID=A0A657PX97_9GAMM|nr:MAG: hypothetical protein B0D94_10480 [Candidatus Sedimenticola endophacoides]OQX37684.1 MAG: hypothetical protein B0D96_01600 [Candidatus Sedimenticola endophacoides]OQX39061.1 MAG: hypothetical protein B0D89_11505 [Candidatus Sedimenticola endophacoides]OQX42432.1 MAG: hypothetical protein B0D88_06645 [Candidatus Sedimenticola endophacoides]OQX44367.1 MAG: hypothetical protein B0D86_05815 [Candidatus Sedimenticola endophacoides]